MYCIGLDVHKKTISYCLKNVGGEVAGTTVTRCYGLRDQSSMALFAFASLAFWQTAGASPYGGQLGFYSIAAFARQNVEGRRKYSRQRRGSEE